MNYLPDISENVDIKCLNSFNLDAKTAYFTTISTIEQLQALLANSEMRSVSRLVLGEGSNILFTKDYPGIIIKNAINGIHLLNEDENHLWLRAGAGENWHELVLYCIKHGYCGLENLSLIPGTVGAAPIQNIGAYGVEVADYLVELDAMRLEDGSIHTFSNQDCQFGYRNSIFKTKYKNQFFILSVVFKLEKKPIFKLDYGNLKETLQAMQPTDINIKAVSDAVIQIRQSKLPDPKSLGNAGSFFKNPVITHEQFSNLQKQHPQLPHFISDDNQSVKVNAAWLIEQCGWKGKRFGNIGVYEKQALILVNHGNGSGAELLDLANKIQQSVKNQFGIELEPEVNLI